MLALLADLAWRRPRRVLVVAVLLAVAAGAFGASTPSHLSASDNDYQNKGSESYRTFRLLSQRTGVIPGPSIVIITSRAEAGRAVTLLRRDSAVAVVHRGEPRAGSVVIAAYLRDGSDTSKAARRIEHAAPGLVGGPAVASEQVRRQSERDLLRAELIAFPLLLALGIWIFRGLVAALLPVAAGVLSIVTTLAMLRLANSAVTISVFALNLVTGAGLGLAIDYSLLLLSRYREELAHSDPEAALRTTVATAGRTVAFSAVTVAAAFASLLVFPLAFLRSMAIGGIAVALLAGVVALLVIPALFALLGRRVDTLALRRGRPPGSGGWYRFAHGVMRWPLPIALATAAVLIALGLPFLGVRFTGVDASVLPTSASARQVQDAIHARAPEHVVASRATLVRVRELRGVTAMTAPRPLGGGLWAADVTPVARPMSGGAKNLVRRIRALPGTSVAGVTAWYLDTSSSLRRHLPAAGAILALTIIALLYLVTRSVILPLKAVVMNALSLSAAFGVLVWVFQDGRLEGVLRYSSQGALELTQPVLLFAIAFGLATDYGVFLLSRIREAHESGLPNREAVALGLERTGRVVTAAALLFCVAVGSFATSGIVIVKEVGLGIALAVAIDASLVRALLVPSLMALLGDWNWWRPGRKRG